MEKRKIILAILLVLCAVSYMQAQDYNINDLRTRAFNGDTRAMLELSQVYEKQGEKYLSYKWLSVAAENGDQEAIELKTEVDLDNCKDPIDYFRTVYKLAQKGDVKAMFRLAKLYDSGKGAVSSNPEEAISWYRKVKSLDSDWFYNNLDLHGQALRSLITEDANNGNVKSMVVLGNYYYDTNNRDAAQKWFKLAANKGNNEAKNKYNEIQSIIKAEIKQEKEESARRARENAEYQESVKRTFRNFAGLWRCSVRNTSQFKFDSNGNGWFRDGPGRKWSTLGIKYMSYNNIRVYDASKVYYLEYNTVNGTFTMGSLVYRKF